MVAAARLRKAQDRMNDARPYTYKLREVVTKLVRRTEMENALFRTTDEPKNILVLVLGSDRGLCGGFNHNLFRVVENEIYDHFSEQLEQKTLSMICFGKKAADFFRARKYPVIDDKIGFFDNLKYEHVTDVITVIKDEFRKGTYDEVYVAFNEFKSVMSQRRKFMKILPVEQNFEQKADTQSGSKNESKGKQKKDLSDIDYLYEPDSATILDYVLPLYINIQLWQASLESFAAEQGARMTAMDSATENAGDIINDLQLKYNQARQAAITTEISEIVSGAEALSE